MNFCKGAENGEPSVSQTERALDLPLPIMQNDGFAEGVDFFHETDRSHFVAEMGSQIFAC